MYTNDSIGCNSNLEKPHKLNLTFWKAKPQCLSEFKSADPKITINKHVSVLPIGIFYWKNYIIRSVKVLGFTQKDRATKLRPTWQLMDVVPRLKLLNALTALTSSSVSASYVVYSQKKFIWIKFAQGLNLNCRSISEIEPKGH
jgi:hypothetical protein